MPTTPLNATPLQTRSVDAVAVLSLPDEEFLHLILDDFSGELERLKRAYSLRAGECARPSSPSPSQILFGEDYDEVNRTLVGALALKWIYKGHYEKFVQSQPAATRLRQDSFQWLHDFYVSSLTAPGDIYTLLTSIVANDLGKDSQLASEYAELNGEDISSQNHDAILLRAAKAGMVRCLDRLSEQEKEDIFHGLELGAIFNFGQLAQAENVPACLSPILDMRGRDRTFRLHFMEQLLDVAGAAGHMDWTCAKVLTQSTFEAFYNVYDACQYIIRGDRTLRGGYDLVLVRRNDLLITKGFRSLDVNSQENRALMRLLCMGGVADLQAAELYDSAWKDLEETTKSTLVKALNRDGSITQPAVQPTYMPALITQAVDVGGPASRELKKRSLQSALRYLARVMSTPDVPSGEGSVIERNVLGTLKEVVQSEEFRTNPEILEDATIPKGVILKM